MLQTLLNTIRANRFEAIRGAALSGRVPVREALLNAVLTEVRRTRDLPTKRFDIKLNASDQFTVFLQPQIGPISPVVKLDFEFVARNDFRQNATLTLRSLGLFGGPTVSLMRTVLLKALKLPDHCIRVEGPAIHIHLREAATALGFGEMASFLHSLQLTTRSGILYIVFQCVVD